jgi:hypothetical protein
MNDRKMKAFVPHFLARNLLALNFDRKLTLRQ